MRGAWPSPRRSTPASGRLAVRRLRPAGGWLGGTGDGPFDSLDRPGADAPLEVASALDDLVGRTAPHLPEGFEADQARATTAPGCVDETLLLTAAWQDAEGNRIGITKTRLVGQFDWSLQPPSGPIERVERDDGSELATAVYDGDLTVRVWLAEPDGTLVRVVAFGARAPTFAGFPTTIPTVPTSEAPLPAPLTLDEAIALAEALRGGP